MDTPYYLTHFQTVIDAVTAHYAPLLREEERDYLERLERVLRPSLCLYVRLANRKGPYFRLSKLAYPECEPLAGSIAELHREGLAAACEEEPLPHGLDALWECFTHKELRELLGHKGSPVIKAEYCARLASEGRHAALLGPDIIYLPPGDCWEFLKFLYFGELTNNLSGFVVQELGHVVVEAVEEKGFQPHFKTREEADDCFAMARRYQRFKQLRGELPPVELYGWWKAQAVARDALPEKALPRHDRLIERLGYALEREKQTALAAALYANTPSAPCRERYAKLLAKEGRTQEAVELCQAMLRSPDHAEEAYAARQLLNRLQGKERRSDARHMLQSGIRIALPSCTERVEVAALNHYRKEGWQGVHSENRLWNALFGLSLWEVIYDASYRSFHQPLQIAPSDLYDKRFYAARAPAIEARLRQLDDKAAFVGQLRVMYRAKEGVTNPFLGWYADTLFWLENLVERLPAESIAAVLRHMAQDVRRHSKGFPDLFLWRGREYMLLEVKSPNDQISPQQFHWLQFFHEHGIQAGVLRVAEQTGEPA